MAAARKTLERELLIKGSCRDGYFARMQRIFDLSKTLNDAATRELFISHCETIDDIRNDFQKCIHDINAISMELDPEFQPDFNAWSGFEDLYCHVRRFKNQLCKPTPSPSLNVSDIKPKIFLPKLPPIEIPEFHGDPAKWSLFYETFNSTINSNPELSSVEKLYYLLGKLKGNSQLVLSGITPNADNYDSIWKALVYKYQDKRYLASTFLDAILETKSLPNPATATQLETFIDRYAASIAALKDLNIPKLCDYVFIHFALKRLDSDTSKAFEMSVRDVEIPTYDSFIKFVQGQVKIMQRTNLAPVSKLPTKANDKPKAPAVPKISHSYLTASCTDVTPAACLLCNKSHDHIYNCREFMSYSPEQRHKFVKDNRLCTNCLSSKHLWNACNSTNVCRTCGSRHHSLIHLQRNSMNKNGPPKIPAHYNVAVSHGKPVPVAAITRSPASAPVHTPATCRPVVDDPSGGVSCLSADSHHEILISKPQNLNTLLGTAQVHVLDRHNNLVICRCIIDPGSQNNFITNACCRKLGLNVQQLNHKMVVKGLGDHSNFAKGKVNFNLFSRVNPSQSYIIHSLVLNQITGNLPTASIDTSSLAYLKCLPLADEGFYQPSEVEILLGAKLFIELLQPGKVTGPLHQPSAFYTTLGYVVMGDAQVDAHVDTDLEVSHSYFSSGLSPQSIHDELGKFFEMEDVKDAPILSEQDRCCEEFYATTTQRDDTGRFVVALPFKDDASLLGDSLKAARKRFFHLERKLYKNKEFKAQYDGVIRDYLNKGYLVEITEPKNCSEGFTLPHHGVIREDKVTSRLRVVLDASAATESGASLNDILHTGPPLQCDLFNILLNFRLFEVAATADIRQMFLQIVTREEDRPYQQIMYRFDRSEPLRYFAFQRVCFGLRSSPFVAIRTVRELAAQEEATFPLAALLTRRDLYVDDIASSFINNDVAINAFQQLIKMFASGGFELVKWSTNSHELLGHVPESHRLTDPVDLDKDESLKILGMQWLPASDTFAFTIAPSDRTCTKRNMLSTVARLWDVLGLVGPVITHAKLLIKEVCSLKLDWDDIPPEYIVRAWSQFQSELPLISSLKIPRHLNVFEYTEITILGFADASERAFGAAVYLHANNHGERTTTFVCAKSKVAPSNRVITMPRLELMAALLLAKLLRSVLDTYSSRCPIKNTYAFSDSTVALHWINTAPHRLQVFVANRVSKIQQLIPAKHFHHIPGVNNPSDCLSRGLLPSQLLNHPLWMSGPTWTQSNAADWPITPFKPEPSFDVPEMKSVTLITTTDDVPLLCQVASRQSNWCKLLNTIVYIYRFLKLIPRQEFIIASDLDFAENKLLTAVQSKHFRDELKQLNSGNRCQKRIQKLKPFIHNGLIRVGGRLSNADLTFDHQHPILLPRKDHIVDLIVDHHHRIHYHTGPTLLDSLLRQRYWIITARRTIRTRIDKCNYCFRTRPKPVCPLMADLPLVRTQVVPKAFVHTGCDYAGPLNITLKRGRGSRSQKAYICLFVCLTTRAIHIELASDLSTQSFMAAFKRFLSRRGPVSVVHSDNAGNMVGAKAYINELHKFITSTHYRSALVHEFNEYKIEWKNTPPSAPHFGSWEPLIKSVKSHLHRSIGCQILTFEEMSTVLCQIENIVNSRPLCTTLTQDPSEPLAITPSHFLTLTPLKYLPAAPVDDRAIHLLERYQLLDKLVQSFWDRWSLEYLSTLQSRVKWNVHSADVKRGTVVLIVQDNKVPPLQWETGVIIDLHPGPDGIARVATIKTNRGIFKRPVVRLCPLPTQ